ncbi:hypothetical protein [Afipia clevelandensis]|uniref:Uncharacterized protein n=1 Tax=Afipia clevelandensis ATCC 49720 TaxID=883079 RepID=K8PAH3_9BRAD|nr:hypothetical protein [Afipia clevelandensis]EKS37739.1 hypothetical protein HMPREF9696_01689 [Afipia clevelandensis ATCC 49720]
MNEGSEIECPAEERVARAICKERRIDPDKLDVLDGRPLWQHHVRFARAAINAMQEEPA